MGKIIDVRICVAVLSIEFRARTIMHAIEDHGIIIISNMDHVAPSVAIEKYHAAKEKVFESYIIKSIKHKQIESTSYEILISKKDYQQEIPVMQTLSVCESPSKEITPRSRSPSYGDFLLQDFYFKINPIP